MVIPLIRVHACTRSGSPPLPGTLPSCFDCSHEVPQLHTSLVHSIMPFVSSIEILADPADALSTILVWPDFQNISQLIQMAEKYAVGEIGKAAPETVALEVQMNDWIK